MAGKTIFDGASPKTQSIEAVKALLTWKGRAVDPLPATVEFTQEGEESRLILVLSNKKDTYYVCTPTKCSCPSQTYRGVRCKHQRKFFPEPTKEAAEVSTEGSLRLARPPKDSIRPTGGWVGPNGERANGPITA